jgi:hypothetical protein
MNSTNMDEASGQSDVNQNPIRLAEKAPLVDNPTHNAHFF